MKTSVTVSLAFILALNAVGSSTLPLQTSYSTFSVSNFGNFNVHRQQNSAALSWIFNTTGVSGFVIKRSYDGSWFETVGQQSPGSGHWNKFLDATVEPGTVYYKIVAVMNDGSNEESPITQVRIVRHR